MTDEPWSTMDENLAAGAVRMVSRCFAASVLGYSLLPAAETLFCSSFFRDSERSSHRRAAAIFLQNPAGKKDGLYRSKSKDKGKGMEDGRYGTFLLKLRVFIADLGRSELISFALFTRRRAVFFSKSSAIARKKEGL